MFHEVIEQIKHTNMYKKKRIQEAVAHLEKYNSFWTLFDLMQICNVKISLSDLFALSKEISEDFSTEDAQAEFIFEHFHEMGIECDFTDFSDLTKEQFALCMHLATIHYCDENL